MLRSTHRAASEGGLLEQSRDDFTQLCHDSILILPTKFAATHETNAGSSEDECSKSSSSSLLTECSRLPVAPAPRGWLPMNEPSSQVFDQPAASNV
jgi:hypothetical protein